MTTRMTWPELCTAEHFKGLWVALDNCRYDASTLQPLEGDVVDSDQELAELCGRLREAGRSSCAILFCEDEVQIESRRPSQIPTSERTRLAR